MRRKFHNDRVAGLRLIFPPGWQIVPGDPEDDLQKWLTTAAYPPPSRRGRRQRNDGWDPVEQSLWREEPRSESTERTTADRTSGAGDFDDDLDREQDDDSWDPAEQALWEEATGGAPAKHTTADRASEPRDIDDDLDTLSDDPDDPDDLDDGFDDGTDYEADDEADDGFAAFISDLYNYFALYVGVWQELPEDAPREDELLGCADWLAEWFMKPWEWFVPDEVHGLDHSIRKATVSGHPAASVWYRYIANEAGKTAAYLRLLLIRRPEGTTSFVLGVAQSDTDRVRIDDCMDSVEPLTARPADLSERP